MIRYPQNLWKNSVTSFLIGSKTSNQDQWIGQTHDEKSLYLFKAKFNQSEMELNNREFDLNKRENSELFIQTKNDLIKSAWN